MGTDADGHRPKDGGPVRHRRFRGTEVYRRDDGAGNRRWTIWHCHYSERAPEGRAPPLLAHDKIGISITIAGPARERSAGAGAERSAGFGPRSGYRRPSSGGGPLTTAALALAQTRPAPVGFVHCCPRGAPPGGAGDGDRDAGLPLPGSVRLGLGLGAVPSLRRMGLDEVEHEAELVRVRYAAAPARRRVVGCAREPDGAVEEVRLEHVPAVPPPIMLAGYRPAGTVHAARDGDGVLLSWVSCPDYVRWARGVTGRGPAARWLGPNAMFTRPSRSCRRPRVSPGRVGALAGACPPAHDRAPRAAPRARPLSGPARRPIRLVRDEWIDQLAVAGDEGDCRRAMRRLAETGTDALVSPVGGKDLLGMLECLSPDTLRAVRA